jgi:hypothetical protein
MHGCGNPLKNWGASCYSKTKVEEKQSRWTLRPGNCDSIKGLLKGALRE